MSENIVLTTVIISTLIIIVLVAMVAVVIFLAKKQSVTQANKMNELAINFEQELRKAELEVSETLMKHVARELHDNLAMIFTSASFGLNQVMAEHDELVKELTPTKETLMHGIADLRMFSKTLNQDYMSSRSLTEMVDIEATRIKLLGSFQVHYFYDQNLLEITKNQELFVFRIFQELIQNILKHAKPNNIHINITNQNGFQLVVSDDGVGFEMEKITNVNGIRNVMERAKLASLSCSFVSSIDNGCTVTVQKENHDN
jgi:signal transduction histidine kinase